MQRNQGARACSAHRDRGFTLVELVVAMVIIAILAAIAIPSYSIYVLRSHRTEAKSALLDLASLEERYFSTMNTYTDDPTKLGYVGSTGVPFPVGSGWYNVLVSFTPAAAPTALIPGGTPATYTITATAIGQQAPDTACATFTVTSTGQQTATGPDCWAN